jgi:hypothetical protein
MSRTHWNIERLVRFCPPNGVTLAQAGCARRSADTAQRARPAVVCGASPSISDSRRARRGRRSPRPVSAWSDLVPGQHGLNPTKQPLSVHSAPTRPAFCQGGASWPVTERTASAAPSLRPEGCNRGTFVRRMHDRSDNLQFEAAYRESRSSKPCSVPTTDNACPPLVAEFHSQGFASRRGDPPVACSTSRGSSCGGRAGLGVSLSWRRLPVGRGPEPSVVRLRAQLKLLSPTSLDVCDCGYCLGDGSRCRVGTTWRFAEECRPPGGHRTAQAVQHSQQFSRHTLASEESVEGPQTRLKTDMLPRPAPVSTLAK